MMVKTYAMNLNPPWSAMIDLRVISTGSQYIQRDKRVRKVQEKSNSVQLQKGGLVIVCLSENRVF